MLPMPTSMPLSRALRTLPIALACAICLACAPPASAGVSNAGLPGASQTDPLAGMQWGYDSGAEDEVYSVYAAASGQTRQELASLALQPTVHWFGIWDTDPAAAAQQYINDTTHGDTQLGSQIAVFRFDPWEEAACSVVPSPASQASYRSWIDSFAQGIGSSRTLIVLQPDMPFVLCSRGKRIWQQMLTYAAQQFNALPHTTVYIDVGAADWVSVSQATSLLEKAGVRWARGFALNATHYDSTQNEVMFGGKVVRALAAARLAGKHFVVNTAENGSPYLYYRYRGNQENPTPCAYVGQRMCATLGIPPTVHVADRRLRLAPHAASIALRFADAYLWIGRPWLDYGVWPFDLDRALALITSSPF